MVPFQIREAAKPKVEKAEEKNEEPDLENLSKEFGKKSFSICCIMKFG